MVYIPDIYTFAAGKHHRKRMVIMRAIALFLI
jgi:hypothetical protein